MSYLNYPRKMLEKRVEGEVIDAVALDEWRWSIARAVIPQREPLSGFDPQKQRVAYEDLSQIIAEYRRLVREDQRPAQRGKVA